jgi:hypothetical protein
MAMTEQEKKDFIDLCTVVMFETKPGDAIYLTQGAICVLELAFFSLAYDNDINLAGIPAPIINDPQTKSESCDPGEPGSQE